ncbi:MAG TPA: hypothetical protein VGK37_11420 [Casimicrobiaceae bacterium]
MDTKEQARRPESELTPRRQRGWIGLVALLLALAIVAVLAQTALKRYGLLGTNGAARNAATGRVPSDAAPRELDPAAVAPAPLNALERARGVEGAVRQQAEEMGKRIDDAAK